MEQISFQMIAAIGEGRSKIMLAMNEAAEGHFEEANKLLQESNQSLVKAHESHFGLIQKEANGEKVELGLLFMHAEDQLMTTSLLKDMAEQMVKMYEKLHKISEG